MTKFYKFRLRALFELISNKSQWYTTSLAYCYLIYSSYSNTRLCLTRENIKQNFCPLYIA